MRDKGNEMNLRGQLECELPVSLRDAILGLVDEIEAATQTKILDEVRTTTRGANGLRNEFRLATPYGDKVQA